MENESSYEGIYQFHIQHKGFFEIRAIKQGRSLLYFFDTPSEVLKKANVLKSLNDEGYNIYYSILPRKKRPEKGGGKKEHVVDEASVLWLDVDRFSVKRPEEYGKLTDEGIKAECLELGKKVKEVLEEHGIRVTALVYSGRGVQPLIKVSQSVNKEEIEELNLKLINLIEGKLGIKIDHAVDCSRLLRLPGFLNVKDPRRPLPTELVELNPDFVTDIQTVRKLSLPEKKTVTKAEQEGEWKNDLGIPLNVIRKVDSKLDELLKGPEQLGYQSLSEADLATISKLWFWRFNKIDIAGIIRQFRTRDKVIERNDYLEHSIGKVINAERFNPVKHCDLLKILKKHGCKFKTQFKINELTVLADPFGSVWFIKDGRKTPKIWMGSVLSAEIPENVVKQTQSTLSALGIELKPKEI